MFLIFLALQINIYKINMQKVIQSNFIIIILFALCSMKLYKKKYIDYILSIE